MANNPPLTLICLAEKVNKTYDAAIKVLGDDLYGFSVLDLMADKMPRIPLSDLRAAIIVSGIYMRANSRIQAQIAGYTTNWD